MTKEMIDAILAKIKSTEKPDQGNARIKEICNRIVRDLCYTIDELDITSEEFWKAMDWLTLMGKQNETGLVVAGTGIEHFLDEKMDYDDAQAGLAGGAARTIEGPLYVAGAPESLGYAELETVPEEGAERLYMQGRITDPHGNPVAGALLEVWHCNLKGLYSIFDSSQPAYNLRRAIRTDADGKYQFKSFVPVGYSCPPDGSTDLLMKALGRHGSRPAHIHFFVTAPEYRKLTTQINIEGDPLLWEDFAFATKEDLVPPITRYTREEAQAQFGRDEAFASIDFDFVIQKEKTGIDDGENHRTRMHKIGAEFEFLGTDQLVKE